MRGWEKQIASLLPVTVELPKVSQTQQIISRMGDGFLPVLVSPILVSVPEPPPSDRAWRQWNEIGPVAYWLICLGRSLSPIHGDPESHIFGVTLLASHLASIAESPEIKAFAKSIEPEAREAMFRCVGEFPR